MSYGVRTTDVKCGGTRPFVTGWVMMSDLLTVKKKEMRFVSLFKQDAYVVPVWSTCTQDITWPCPFRSRSFYSKGFPPLSQGIHVYIYSPDVTQHTSPKPRFVAPRPKGATMKYFCVWGMGFPFLSRTSSPSRKLNSKSTRKKQSSRKTYVNSTSSRHMLG